MVEDGMLRPDRFVASACVVGGLTMAALTLGAADFGTSRLGIAIFVLLGLVPYVLTTILSLVRPWRRIVLATARAVAVVFGIFDCGLRYAALYHPHGSTDALVVAVLPFWWLPIVFAVGAVTSVVSWLRSRRAGGPAGV